MCTALPGHAQAVTVGANSRIKLPALIECLILLGPRPDLCDHPASSLGKFKRYNPGCFPRCLVLETGIVGNGLH